MKTRAELKADAKAALKGNWTGAVVAVLIFSAITSVVQTIAGSGEEASIINVLALIVLMVISGPFNYGLSKYFLWLSQGKKVDYALVFDGFKDCKRTLILTILISIKVFLWSLLFVIPGIIAGLRYSQAFNILVENDKISANEAIKRSIEMMKGHLWEYFVLGLSFFGWAFLAIFTFGLGFLWLAPYSMTTCAGYYLQLKKEA